MSVPPSGITPAANYEVAGLEPQLPPPVILADKIDPKTGDFASLSESYGIAEGMALFLLTVQRGTGAAVRGFGQRFREITHLDANAAGSFEAFAREALAPAVASGTLRFDSIGAETDAVDGSQLNTQVAFVDLLAKRTDPNRRKTFSP